jgi:hypothetical protein
MEKPYRFVSGEDPTDAQLEEIMVAMAKQVKENAEAADLKLSLLKKKQQEEAFRKHPNLFLRG